MRSWAAAAPFTPLMIVSFLGMGDVTTLAVLGATLFAGFQDTKVRAVPVGVMLQPLAALGGEEHNASDVALDTLKEFALDDFNDQEVGGCERWCVRVSE